MILHFWITIIYQVSPIWLQNIMISVYGYKLKKLRYGKIYYRYLEYLKQKDYSDSEKEKQIQNEEFIKLLHYTVAHSKFYRKFYQDIDIDSIKSVDDISKLPILDKETLRTNIQDVFTINPKEGSVGHTGGTTGKSLSVVYTKEDVQKRMAYLDAFKYKHGFENMKMKSARFNGKNIIPLKQKKKCFWRDNWSIKQRIYSSFYLSQENLPYYVADLNKYKPVAIDGFATSIYEIAKYMKEHNIKAEFSPVAVFPTSETVLPIHREVISEVFGCPVRDQYGSSEGAPGIIECVCGHMHECIDTGVFEHIDTPMGKKLLVTSFTTYGTPLIRYEIGDNILENEDDSKCECGSVHPMIKAIDGRKADYLISQERGNINLGNLSNVIKDLPNCVKNIQFVQNTLSQIDIFIVVDEQHYMPEYDRLLQKEMIYRFGENMSFPIHRVHEISRAKSGKYQLIINNIS